MTENIDILVTGRDAASGPLNNIRSTLSKLQGDVKGGILAGIGLGAGISAFNLASEAVRGVVGGIGDAVTAAKTLEAANAVLFSAIKQNIPTWDGNTAAIDAATTAGEKLGFTNLEQRTSMGLLVAQTKNVNDALLVQRVAMDVARLTGRDLGSATLLLGKAYDGVTTSLKRMGIIIPPHLTGMAAIAAVQKVVAGSAEAFGSTSAGASAKLTAAFEALQEKVGNALLPAITSLTTFAADKLIPALASIGDFLSHLGPAADVLRIAAEALGVVLGVRLVFALGRAGLGMFGLVGPAATATTALTAEAAAGDLASKSSLGLLGPLGLAAGALTLLGEFGAKAYQAINPVGYSFNELAGQSHKSQYQIQQDIADTADKLGISQDAVRATILDTAKTLNTDYVGALNAVQTGQKAVASSSADMAANVKSRFDKMATDSVDALNYDAIAITIASKDTWGKIPLELDKARMAAIKLALVTPGQVASALRAGRDAVKSAAAQLAADITAHIAPKKEIATLLGELHGKYLAAGLKSSDPIVRASAQALQQTIYDRLSALDAYAWGQAIAVAWAKGVASMWGYAHAQAVYLGTSLTGPLRGYSPPVEGPLKDIDKWGFSIGKAWSDSLSKGAAGFSLSSMVAPPSLAFAGAGSGMSRVGSSANITINVNAPLGTPAAGQALAREVIPEIVRQMRRDRFLPQ